MIGVKEVWLEIESLNDDFQIVSNSNEGASDDSGLLFET